MSAFDPERIRQVAIALKTDARYIEKDWHLVRALAVIASIDMKGVTSVLSGGTSLATAWQLIHRFSEDVDFKVSIDAGSASAEAKQRRQYRKKVIEQLQAAGFILKDEPLVGNKSRFFRASFHYDPKFPAAGGIRPGLQVEMTFTGTLRPPKTGAVQSLLSRTFKEPSEVPSLPCVDPVETAADKLSALAWRTAARDRSTQGDDPSIVRHLHDLAALLPQVGQSAELRDLTRRLLESDAKRSGDPMANGLELLQAMLPKITADPLWQREYEEFVNAVSFGRDDERISFDRAVEDCAVLVGRILA